MVQDLPLRPSQMKQVDKQPHGKGKPRAGGPVAPSIRSSSLRDRLAGSPDPQKEQNDFP